MSNIEVIPLNENLAFVYYAPPGEPREASGFILNSKGNVRMVAARFGGAFICYDYREAFTSSIPNGEALANRVAALLEQYNIVPVERGGMTVRRHELFDGPWSNDACRGYAIMAMKGAGVDEETIKKVMLELHREFDWTSVEEAAEYYRKGTVY